MIDVNELRKGVTFELDGNLLKVLDYSHNKTGRGNANIKVKARNLLTGSTIERTFSSGQSVQDVNLDFANVSYLYSDGDLYYFMDNVTFEQPGIKKESLGESAQYLKEGMEVKLTFYKGEAIDIELPTSVDLKGRSSRYGNPRRYCHRRHKESHHRDRRAGAVSELCCRRRHHPRGYTHRRIRHPRLINTHSVCLYGVVEEQNFKAVDFS